MDSNSSSCNITVSKNGILQASVLSVSSNLVFMVFSVVLTLMSYPDIPMVVVREPRSSNGMTHPYQKNFTDLCVEKTSLGLLKKAFFCPPSAPSKLQNLTFWGLRQATNVSIARNNDSML